MALITQITGLLTKEDKKRGFLLASLVVLMAAFEAVGVASVMPFLAVLGNPSLVNSTGLLSEVYSQSQQLGVDSIDDFLILLGIGVFALIIVSALLKGITHYAMINFIETMRYSISSRLLRSYLQQPYPFFLGRHSGEMTKTVLSEVDQLIMGVVRPVYQMIAFSLIAISIVAILVFVNPLLAAITGSVLGGSYGSIYFLAKRRLRVLGNVRLKANEQRFLAASEAFGGIKTIKLAGTEEAYVNRFFSPSKKFAKTQVSYEMTSVIPNVVIEALVFGSIILLTIWLLFAAGGSGSSALGEILPILGLYALSALRLKPAVQNIYSGFTSLKFGQAALINIYNDLHEPNEFGGVQSKKIAPLETTDNLKFSDLSFRYRESSTQALDNINLTIPVGTSLGIVGGTGAGKTTFVDVLLGLLIPDQGRLLLDDTELTRELIRSWQGELSYVPQDIFLADCTIAENIAFGVDPQHIDMSKVETCAKAAQIHAFISEQLPSGFDTKVGERGNRLSGGQKQRIGIARALYSDKRVLVFDEATSALDNLTEAAVMKSISRLRDSRTLIIIAHRLSTVKDCDQILFLENGRVSAVGPYHELLNKNENFQKLASASASD